MQHNEIEDYKATAKMQGTDVLRLYYIKHSFDCQYRFARKMKCKAAGPHLTGGSFVNLFFKKVACGILTAL
jgi:hypothetical protein